MATKQELKARLVTGHVITEQDMKDLVDVAGEQGTPGTDGKDGAKGDPGVKGDPGEKGDPGNDGADGADGFGTEAQYNDIIARLDALEDALVSDE